MLNMVGRFNITNPTNWTMKIIIIVIIVVLQ